jgi:hypothetical protein
MKLYRFQTINKFSIQNLTNQKNWLSNPLEFNDPFEFSFYDSIFIDHDKNEYRTLSQNEKLQAEKFKNEINEYGVVCYTTHCFNNLLWAHYGDHHKGMCLVFNVISKKKDNLHEVKYQKHFPKIELLDDSKTNEEIIKIVTTKSIEWNYEEEYREIFPEKNKLHKYPGKLIEIIFGCRTPFEDINMISNIAIMKNDKIKISKMEISQLSYNLTMVTKTNNKSLLQFLKENDGNNELNNY